MKEMYFNDGVSTSNGEMRYYYADGRVSNLKLPQVFIDWGNPVDFTFSSSPLKGAGFYRIGDPSEQTGSFSSNFRYIAPINPGYTNGLNVFGVANGAKTNLIEAAVRYNFSDNQMWHQFRGLDKAMTGIGFLSPVGFAISSTYFIIDVSTSGFGGFGKIR